jgi:hypothetical protein
MPSQPTEPLGSLSTTYSLPRRDDHITKVRLLRYDLPGEAMYYTFVIETTSGDRIQSPDRPAKWNLIANRPVVDHKPDDTGMGLIAVLGEPEYTLTVPEWGYWGVRIPKPEITAVS